jgi:hypothetical protein
MPATTSPGTSPSPASHHSLPAVGDATTATSRDPASGPPYLRASPPRASKLWRYISTVAGTTQLSVLLTDDHETAAVRPHPSGDGWLVVITTREIPQPATNLDRDDFDYRVQHALGLHETGHILYTDFDAWVDSLTGAVDGYPDPVASFVKQLFNAFEDGVIEQCLREAFSDTAAGRLHLANQNLRQNRLGAVPAAERATIHAPAAVQTAAADLAVADSGVTRRLCDPAHTEWQFAGDAHREAFLEVLPVLQTTHQAAMTAQSPAARYEAMAECACTVVDTLFGDVDQPSHHHDSSQQAGNGDASGRDGSGRGPLDADPETADDAAGVGSPHPMPAGSQADDTDDGGDPSGTVTAAVALDDAVDTPAVEQTPACSEADVAAEQAAVTGRHPDDTDQTDAEHSEEPTTSGDTDATPNRAPADTDADPTDQSETDGDAARDTACEDQRHEPTAGPDQNPDQTSLAAFEDDHQNAPDTGGSDTARDPARPPPDQRADGNDRGEQTGEQRTDPDSENPDPSPDGGGERPLRPGPLDDADSREADPAGVASIPGIDPAPPGRLQDERGSARQHARDHDAAESTVETALAALEHDVEVLPELDGSFDAGRWSDSVAAAAPVAERFKARLTQDRQRDTRSGTLAGGRPDGRLLYNTATGDPRVLQQRASGEEKRYQFVLILDRSGSMAGRGDAVDPVADAETAVIQVATALEDCGVDVAIIDFYRRSVRVIKPFSLSVAAVNERLATGNASGNTPLGNALEVAIELLDAETGTTPGHIVAMTDDRPSDETRYKAAFTDSPYPVHGTLINHTNSRTPPDGETELYDTAVSVTATNELRDRILQLAATLVVPR